MGLREELLATCEGLPEEVEREVGADQVAAHAGNHRVVLVPMDDEFLGGDDDATLMEVFTTVRVYLQAPDWDQLRALRDSVLGGMRKKYGPAGVKVRGGIWGEQDGSGLVLSGPSYELAVALRLADVPTDLATSTSRVVVKQVHSTAEVAGGAGS